MYKIAIVDDNESWCFVLASSLRLHGYRVSTFTSANSFLPHAGQFDLALIDFLLPPRRYETEVDGPQLICQLKQRLSNPPLLILISAYFIDDVLNQASGICPQADAYLGKGLSVSEIVHQIDRLLAMRSSPLAQRNGVNR